MCPPPLVCPLCASAGGFTSPGALWLGLIGVANRLLSCPVCHELLLGLDKLTIHLVSHVPDLNVLASSIGNHIDLGHKTNDESTVTEASSMKGHCTNATIKNSTLTRRKQSPRMNAKTKEITSPHGICPPSSFTEIPTSNNQDSSTLEDNLFNSQINRNQHCLNQVQYDISQSAITTLLPSSETKENPEVITAPSKEGACSEIAHFKSNQENSADKMPMDITSGPMVGILREKDVSGIGETSKSNLVQNLPKKQDKYLADVKSDSYCQTQSFSKPSENIIPVVEPINRQISPLIQNDGNEWKHYENKYLEVEDSKSKSENNNVKSRCHVCSMSFDDPKCLQLHNIIVHSSQDLLNSPFDQTTSHPMDNFPCQLCNRKLSSNSDLLVHMRFAHSVIPGNSPDNDIERKLFSAESKEKLLSQISFLNQESQSKGIQTDVMLSKMNKVIEVTGRNLLEKLEEENCPRKSDPRENILSIDDRQNNSNDSLRTTDNENSLDTSKDEYSNGSPPQQYIIDDEIKHTCKICNAQFSSIAELIAHRPAHVEENGCICMVCGKSFKKEQHLQQHLRTHEGKQWECDVCCKFFTTKYFLKKHKRLHTGEMPYCCETCGKTFTFQQSYHKHLLYHSDEKPHACSECGKRFKELSTLHNHERIHTGEKPFTCESCGKAFRQRVSYLVHRRIHTGVMPYKCTACEKSFRYKVSQRTHKCSSQQTGTVVRQSSDLVERLLSHQKDKSTTDECLSQKSEVTFLDVSGDQSSKTNQKDGKLENLSEFSPQGVIKNKKMNSFNLDPDTSHPEATIVLNDSQNANSSFLEQISSSLATDHCCQGKAICNFGPALMCDSGEIKENDFNFKQKIEKGKTEGKNSGATPVSLERRDTGATLPDIMERGNPECGPNFAFNCESTSKLPHIPVLYNDDLERKGAVIHGNDNAVGEDFGLPVFPSTSNILTHSQSDFFELVLPPADPALEKLGKLSISSVHSPEKSTSGSNFSTKENLDENLQNCDSTSKDNNVSSPVIQKSFDDHCSDSKSGFLEMDHCPELSRDQDTTANASDLSSFLQSCLEQWHPSNFISNDKDKEGISSQSSLQSDVNKANSCPTEDEDNRLHTINEESLRRLLYGDSVP